MKNFTLLFLTISAFIITSCSSNNDELAEKVDITINFNHLWDDDVITIDDFNITEYENDNDETLTIERLRYLISNIYVKNDNDIITDITDYVLVDLGEDKNTTLSAETLLIDGTYDLYMTFGFSDEDNYIEEGYTDLNSESFEVPSILGGGYHYMQFDGKFINSLNVETGFNYHMVRATNATTTTGNQEEILATGIDTSFEIDLGEIEIENNAVTINIAVDIAEWFVNPNTWDLNEFHQMLMPNYDAQIMMNANGTSVFSLVEEEEDE